jgi:hypothetical protein
MPRSGFSEFGSKEQKSMDTGRRFRFIVYTALVLLLAGGLDAMFRGQVAATILSCSGALGVAIAALHPQQFTALLGASAWDGVRATARLPLLSAIGLYLSLALGVVGLLLALLGFN